MKKENDGAVIRIDLRFIPKTSEQKKEMLAQAIKAGKRQLTFIGKGYWTRLNPFRALWMKFKLRGAYAEMEMRHNGFYYVDVFFPHYR